MKPQDIADVLDVVDPRVAPDGRTVAFVVVRPDVDDNRNASQIWVSGIDADLPPIPFTDGTQRESRPRWSPDGARLALVAHPEEKGATLRVADVEEGGSIDLLDWPEDIEDVAWTPDGTRIVFLARARDDVQYEAEKDRDRPPRRIDRLEYRLDNVGWTMDRPRHLFSIAADGGDDSPTPLTAGPYQDSGIAIAPDGRSVVFSSARTPTWDTDLSTHLYRIPIEGGADPEKLTAGLQLHGQPAFSPDGARVSFVWGDRHSMMRHGQLGVIDLEVSDPATTERLVTVGLGLHCAPYLAAARDPIWDGDDALVFQVDEAGNVPVYRMTLDGEVTLLVTGDRQVGGFDLAGGTLAFVATGATELTDVFVVVDGVERRLTTFAEHFAATHELVAPERFVATSPDGTEVEAWVMRPVGFVEGVRYPVLLNIHGGPFSQYGNRLFDEFQIQAGAGYAVVYGNPRGSSGYSEAFSRAIRGPKAEDDPGSGWGGVDYEDVMAVLDTALDRFDFLDPERLGVLGGSYGGYMTSWIVGHTDRFKAALSERACNNLLTFAHTSDIGAQFPAGYIGASHLDDPDEFLRQSPVTYWRDITTPLLIVHSEDDLRCPIEQAEDLYVRLKLAGKDVEFVRFPGEGHELSRSGAPRHRVQRMEVVLDWFDRRLR